MKHNRIEPGDGLLVRIERDGDTLQVSNRSNRVAVPPPVPAPGCATSTSAIDCSTCAAWKCAASPIVSLVRVPLLPCSP